MYTLFVFCVAAEKKRVVIRENLSAVNTLAFGGSLCSPTCGAANRASHRPHLGPPQLSPRDGTLPRARHPLAGTQLSTILLVLSPPRRFRQLLAASGIPHAAGWDSKQMTNAGGLEVDRLFDLGHGLGHHRSQPRPPPLRHPLRRRRRRRRLRLIHCPSFEPQPPPQRHRRHSWPREAQRRRPSCWACRQAASPGTHKVKHASSCISPRVVC